MNERTKQENTKRRKTFQRLVEIAMAAVLALLAVFQGLTSLTVQSHFGHGDLVAGDKIIFESQDAQGPAGLRLRNSRIGNFQGNLIEGMSIDEHSEIGNMEGNVIRK